MNRVMLSIWDILINVCSDNDDFISFVTSIENIAGIPLADVNNRSRSKPDASFCLIEGVSPNLDFSPASAELTLTLQWSLVKDYSTTILNLIGQLISWVCINRSLYPLHSAAVCTDDAAILLIGGPDSGKTILSTSLSSTGLCKWISNDWLALANDHNGVEVVKGYDLIDFNPNSIDQLKNQVPRQFVNNIQKHHSLRKKSWYKSSLYKPEHLGLEIGKLPCPVDIAVFISIAPGLDTTLDILPESRVAELILRELFWPLRGLGSFVIGSSGDIYYPSLALEPLKGWSAMCNFVNIFTHSCKCYSLNANLENAVDSIKVIIDGSDLPPI